PTPRAAEAAARRAIVDRWPRQVSGDSEFGDRLRGRGRLTRTRSELREARTPGEVIEVILRTALEEHRPSAIAWATVDVGGALVLLGSHGIPPAVAARWQRVPVEVPLPVCVTARTGQGRWWFGPDPDRPGALGLGLPERWQVAAVLALPRSAGHQGVLAMTWPDGDHAPAPGDRGEIEAVAREVAMTTPRAPAVVGSARAPGGGRTGSPDPALAVLDMVWQPILLCTPVIGQDRTVEDLRVWHANPAATRLSGREELVGRRLIELFPDAVRTGLFTACLRVWETGEHLELHDHRSRLTDPAAAQRPADVLATRYQDGVLITWGRRCVPDGADR
ncbi:MAG: PAS domain-containing protein, partial [Kineosporiaceae bacterium]